METNAIRPMLVSPVVGEQFTSFDRVLVFYEPLRGTLLLRLHWSVGLTQSVVFDLPLLLSGRVAADMEEVKYSGEWYSVRCIPSRRVRHAVVSKALRTLEPFLTKTERQVVFRSVTDLRDKKFVDYFRRSRVFSFVWHSQEYGIECASKPVHLIEGDFLYGRNATAAWLQPRNREG